MDRQPENVCDAAASILNNVRDGASPIHVDKCSTKIFLESATRRHGGSKRPVLGRLGEPKRVDNHCPYQYKPHPIFLALKTMGRARYTINL
jgi:hypothetical protein